MVLWKIHNEYSQCCTIDLRQASRSFTLPGNCAENAFEDLASQIIEQALRNPSAAFARLFLKNLLKLLPVATPPTQVEPTR